MSTNTDEPTNPRCCVFQPFDNGGAFDKRFDDILKPAIEAAGLEAYRVDRDRTAVVIMDTLHEEIERAAICLADISTNNPNVMYELGYALAKGKSVVILSAKVTDSRFPFDIQHRPIIRYEAESTRDFNRLQEEVTAKLKALVHKQELTTKVASTPVRGAQGLEGHEATALALIAANLDGSDDLVSASTLKYEMTKALFTNLATRLALTKLTRLGYVTEHKESQGYDDNFFAYRLSGTGEDWLLENQSMLNLTMPNSEAARNGEPARATARDDLLF
jgi:nucleoside 2-deoxyribosyltransferase